MHNIGKSENINVHRSFKISTWSKEGSEGSGSPFRLNVVTNLSGQAFVVIITSEDAMKGTSKTENSLPHIFAWDAIVFEKWRTPFFLHGKTNSFDLVSSKLQGWKQVLFFSQSVCDSGDWCSSNFPRFVIACKYHTGLWKLQKLSPSFIYWIQISSIDPISMI